MKIQDAQFAYVKPPKPKGWERLLFWASLFAQMIAGLFLLDVAEGLDHWFMRALFSMVSVGLLVGCGARAALREAYYEGRLLPKLKKFVF